MTVSVPLFGTDLVALVDDEDGEAVLQCRWYLKKDGPRNYAQRNVKVAGKWRKQQLHLFLLGNEVSRHIDHENHDGLDNRRSNLRIATPSQNQMNARARPGTSSAFKGVSWYPKYGKWVAYINIARKRRFLGYFELEADAAEAYRVASTALFGEFACWDSLV